MCYPQHSYRSYAWNPLMQNYQLSYLCKLHWPAQFAVMLSYHATSATDSSFPVQHQTMAKSSLLGSIACQSQAAQVVVLSHFKELCRAYKGQLHWVSLCHSLQVAFENTTTTTADNELTLKGILCLCVFFFTKYCTPKWVDEKNELAAELYFSILRGSVMFYFAVH